VDAQRRRDADRGNDDDSFAQAGRRVNRRGVWIRACAAAVFDDRTMEHVIDPAIADLRAEPFSMSRYLAVLQAVTLCIPRMTVPLGRTLGVSALALVAVVAVFEVLPLLFAWQQEALDLRMPLYLIPQGLTIATSVAIAFGVLHACGGRNLSRRVVLIVALLAVFSSVTSFVNAGWLTPAANQAYRVALAVHLPQLRGPFARGPAEFTLGEVHRQLQLATTDPNVVAWPEELHLLAASYYGRWAVTLAPIAFAVFALALAGRQRWMRWTLGPAVCVAYLAYLFFLDVPRLVTLDGWWWLGGAVWYPLVVLALISAAMVAGSAVAGRSGAEVSR
jgi:hypothetical protein